MAIFLAGADSVQAQGRSASPPSFSDIDTNGDGVIDAEEFAANRAARMGSRQGMQGQGQKGQGQGQKGQGQGMGGQGQSGGRGARMPTYADLDTDADGCVSPEEFQAHQASRHGSNSKSP